MCQAEKAVLFCQLPLWMEIIQVNVANFYFLKLYFFHEDKQLSSSSQFLVRAIDITKAFSEISGR